MDLTGEQQQDGAIDLDLVRIDAALARRVPESLAVRRRVLPFGADDDAVYAACLDPDDHGAIEALERAVGRRVVAVRANAASLDRALGRVFLRPDDARGDEAVRLVEELLQTAILEQASDLHIEPGRDEVRIRARIDGNLEALRRLEPDQLPALSNRVKVLAGMDIGDRRLL
ncbi:MAG: Flp pilus assembly complex ATPase component TadA [Planctomycetes bacterium]|nr:Flp pilus assembly complex ATPase component TadA [Planctomycetota bacterium]